MSETKNYEPFKIPDRQSVQENKSGFISPKKITDPSVLFEEIEIDGGTKSLYEPAPIPPQIEPVMDEKRKLFNSMREISRYNHSSYFSNSKFYFQQTVYEDSKVFYKQAMFMKDFEDDYNDSVPFIAYFPYYQLMSYEQLRTYFTWRTKVRQGIIEKTSLSYAFVFIYELLNNIGINDPADGLDRLLAFWSAFRDYDTSVERYLIRWIKDYCIYYELPKSFKEIISDYNLQDHYPDITANNYDPVNDSGLEQLCGISKYNIKKSHFYTDKTSRMIDNCLEFVFGRIKNMFAETGIDFNNLIYQSSRSKSVWNPFIGALFYPIRKQPDRKIVLSAKEIYVCSQNRWFTGSAAPSENGKQLVGYIIKQTESVLRKVTAYEHKLTADISKVDMSIVGAGINFENIITDAVMEFHREKNKTVVAVDESVLNKIRLEALDTQEKLTVPEDEILLTVAAQQVSPPVEEEKEETPTAESDLSDSWTSFRAVLSEIEINALRIVLQDEPDINKAIKQFANENNVMLEVLADSINEKAFDSIGDNILELDESVMIYDEYKEKVMKMVDGYGK